MATISSYTSYSQLVNREVDNKGSVIGQEKHFKIEKTRQYSDEEIKAIASKYKYMKDSIFGTDNKIKKEFEVLTRFKHRSDIDNFLVDMNENNKKRFEISDFEKERKKVRTLTQFVKLHGNYDFTKGTFIGMETNSQEYKDFIADAKSGKILMWLDERGSFNYGDVSKLNPGVTPKLHKGSIIISPE